VSEAPPPVLVVDDQPRLATLVVQLLGRLGFKDTHVSEDGETALSMLTERRYSLVVCDLELPGMDGLQLLKEVRKSSDLAGTPFIVSETTFFADDVRQAMNLGADGILLKPYEAPILRAKVAYATGEKARRRRREFIGQAEFDMSLMAMARANFA